ncbi:hypothetical protein K435DRAFT_560927, partial [Dendrothele bispora CBS 962.96]
MVGCSLLAEISEALSKATGVNDLFGGMNVIFSGDFAQLPPVIYTRLYAKVNRNKVSTISGQKDLFGKLAWLSVDTVVCLEENKRSDGDKVFAEVLKRLRMGSCTDEDCTLLRSRIAASVQPDWSTSPWSTAPLIVTENAIKDEANILATKAFAKRVGRPLQWYYA